MRVFVAIIMTLSLLSFSVKAEDYKSAQRFKDGDVISAAVLNDILDRIELTLKSIQTSELVGTWEVTWRTCALGGSGNCNSLNVGTGWGSTVDGLYKERTDTWVISDDEDDTYSVAMNKCFAGAVSGVYYNDACTARVAVNDGIALFGAISGTGIGATTNSHSSGGFYNIKRVSSSRFLLWRLNSGSNSFVSYRLDKQALPPAAPTSLVAAVDATAISLSWTKGDDDATSYDVQRKTTFDGTFTSLGTATTTSYSDTGVTANADYWYRVFAKNDNGTSIGSNVVKLTYVTSTAPAAATSLAATVGTGFVSLTWTAGDDTATSYEIKRKTGADGTYSAVGTTSTTTSFSDTTGFTDGTSYSYQVFAKNANGTAAGSNVVTVTYE